MFKKYWPTWLLLILLVWVQAQIWSGPGSLTQKRKLEKELQQKQTDIEAMRAENKRLQAEVFDLENGMESVEELARMDVGMIKRGEIFVQTKE